jgi:DNA-binding transcriptional LysR family regulator
VPHLPLNALRAFEAASRLGSMTAAAAELRVTHGAISRHVKALEGRFGLPLLQRLPRAVVATKEGAQLAADLAEAFERMHMALSRVQPAPLTLSCSATIMMNWLLPRLGRFKRDHPTVELRLNVNYGEVDFIRDEISVAIRNDMYQPPPMAIASLLLREEIGPVCHPDYARRLSLSAPSDLVRARLLSTETRPQAWSEWVGAIGASTVALTPQERFEHFYLVIQAAACGLGVALVPRMLVESEIAAGHLVAPFGFTLGPHSLALWIAQHLRARSDVQQLAAWLRAEMTQLGPDRNTQGVTSVKA